MADRMTDYCSCAQRCCNSTNLSHKHAFHVRACEKTVVFVVHARCVYSVYTIDVVEHRQDYDHIFE